MAQVEHTPGRTRDTGYQIGVRRTLAIAPEAAWQLLTSVEGRQLWLGNAPELRFEQGATYQTAEGAWGEVRVVRPGRQLRITWQPHDWPRASTIQIRIVPKAHATTIALHQEWLPDPDTREQRRVCFAQALQTLAQQAREIASKE